MTRIWNTPVFILATVYFVVDGVFSYLTRPITCHSACNIDPLSRGIGVQN